MSKWCLPVLDGSPNKNHFYTVQTGLGFLSKSYYDIRQMVHTGADWNAITGGDSDLRDLLFGSYDNGLVIERGFYGGWGNILLVEYASAAIEIQLAHLDSFNVGLNEKVQMGDVVGRMGKGGRSYSGQGPFWSHVHVEVRPIIPGQKRVSPYNWPSSTMNREDAEAFTRKTRVDPEKFFAKVKALKTYRAVQAARVA